MNWYIVGNNAIEYVQLDEQYPNMYIASYNWLREIVREISNIGYCVVGRFGEFDELSMIRQTKTIQISTYN